MDVLPQYLTLYGSPCGFSSAMDTKNNNNNNNNDNNNNGNNNNDVVVGVAETQTQTAPAPSALQPLAAHCFTATTQHMRGVPRGPVKRHIGCSIRDWSALCAKTREPPVLRRMTPEEVRKHCEPDDLWIVIHGVVYDCTKFQHYHPGGESILRKFAGMDCTAVYDCCHSWISCKTMLGPFAVGTIEKTTL